MTSIVDDILAVVIVLVALIIILIIMKFIVSTKNRKTMVSWMAIRCRQAIPQAAQKVRG